MIKSTTNYSLVISFLLLSFSFLLSFYFYRNSQLTSFKKYFLLILKAFTFFFILILFIEPSFLTEKNVPIIRTNILLVDNSRSNQLPSSDKSIKDIQIKNLLAENWGDINNLKTYSFSSGESKKFTLTEPDSLKFQGFETNLSEALTNIKNISPEEEINSITLVSDGCFNNGGNPLYKLKEFNCPVFTFAIGDTMQQKDIVIEQVLFNEKSFTNTKNIIKVIFSAFEMGNQNFNIKLEREGSIIASKNIQATGSLQSLETDFDIVETKEGSVKYRVTAESIPGEITYKNNYYDFLIKYIDNKVNILYLSSGPGFDNSFIIDILKRVDNYNLTTRILKNQSDFYEGPIDYNKFGDLSLIFLMGFPSAQVNNNILESISSRNKDFKIPVLFFAQKNTDYMRLESLNEFTPLSITRPSGGENLITLKSTGAVFFKENMQGIENTPQIFKNVSGIIPKTGSIVLVTDRTSGEPILITNKSANNNSTAFLGYGIWRWGLNDKTNNEKIAETFILSVINGTLSMNKKEKLIVEPEKNVFDYTEPVTIKAEVYDNNYNKMTGAKVKANILKYNGSIVTKDIEFSYIDNKYQANISSLPPGDYTIEAEAYTNDNLYAKNSSRFLADTLTTEYLTTKSDFNQLRTISQNTAGEFYNNKSSFANFKEKLSNIKKESSQKVSVSTKSYNLWENKYILIFIILLFSVEWFLRKRYNIL
jgi:hypothetical protein